MKIGLRKRLQWLKKFLVHPAKSDEVMDGLEKRATSPDQQEHRWKDGAKLSEARNAHYTNNVEEMTEALSRDFNFMEGDIWLEGAVREVPGLGRFREPIMAHDPDEVDGLSLSEWLDLGQSSGKGLKLDIKHSAAIPDIIDLVKEKAIPQERLIFNADVNFGPGVERDFQFRFLDTITDFTTNLEEMKSIREAFPESTIGLGHYTRPQAPGTVYSDQQLQAAIDFALEIGGPVTFPLRAEFVTPEVVETLKPYGSVSIWNDPKSFDPGDKKEATAKFRRWGVNGMIDLRSPTQTKKSPIYERDLWPDRLTPPPFRKPE